MAAGVKEATKKASPPCQRWFFARDRADCRGGRGHRLEPACGRRGGAEGSGAGLRPNSAGDSVDVIDPGTHKGVEHFPVGALPQHVTPSHDMKTLYVNDDVGNTLTPIDPLTSRYRRTAACCGCRVGTTPRCMRLAHGQAG
jgi:DNA-binding beta-propeller fold protein YncE